MDIILQGLLLLVDFKVILVIILSAIYGLFVGSVPGLTATMATALLIPFTFYMDPVPATVSIVTVSAMAIFAGDIPAALVRIPGTPASAAYTQDSFELTKQGKAEMVLGVDVVFSVIGGLIGAVILMTLAPLLVEIAFKFTTFEYFWLATMGLSATVMVSRGSQIKGALSVILGLFLSTIGLDITLGYPRFTFGIVELLGGVNFIPAMIGLFGVSEVIRSVMHGELAYPIAPVQAGKIFTGMLKLFRRYKMNVLRSGLMGTVIGILPGAGADIASWIAYAFSKRASKEPEKYGVGSIEAIIDAGTANNSCLAGTWIPALIFGIPGDSITAIVIGVLFMKGLRPGPMIFERAPDMLYAVYLSFILANLLMIPFGYLAIKCSSQMLKVPRNILMPGILMFSIVGSFAINNTVFDVGTMLLMGVVGYFLEANGFSVAPIVLGLVLGPIVEKNFMMSMIKTEWDVIQFFTRPVSGILCTITIFIWFYRVFIDLFERARRRIR
jgi:putative tricarboxylic transport membrane protein